MSNCESCFLSLQDKHRFKLCIWTHRRQIDDRIETSTYFGEWSFIICVVPITYSNTYPTRCIITQFIYIWKLLYMFRVVPPPIIRTAYKCIYSIWYLSHRYCHLPLSCRSKYEYIPIYIQQDATLHNLFISGNCSTRFRWYLHPSSGAHTNVSTASGICHTVTAICRYRVRVGT